MKEMSKEIFDLIDTQLLDVTFISSLAGDSSLSENQQEHFQELKKQQGNLVYSDIIYALSHKRFPAEKAKELWNNMLEHKKTLTRQLKRNPGIVVTAVDYLSNIHEKIEDPVIFPEKKIDQIVNAAANDTLTGLFKKSIFEFLLNYEIKQFKRHAVPFSIMMIDVDDFKDINDTRGHLTGDYVLQAVAERITETIREGDSACRFGGDEFIILMPETDLSEAFNIGQRIQKEIAATISEFPVTLSIGISSSGADSDTHDSALMIEKADTALYISKKNGKNRITKY